MTGDVMKQISKLRASPRFAAVSLLGRILYLPGHIAPDARGLRACEDVTRALGESGAREQEALFARTAEACARWRSRSPASRAGSGTPTGKRRNRHEDMDTGGF